MDLKCLKENVNIIINSDILKSLNKRIYLCSCFAIDDNWQYDFYDKKTKRITSFRVDDEVRLLDQDSKVFQKESVDLEKLNLNDIKVDLNEALLKVDLIKKEKAGGESINKKIIILQKIKVPLWNISFVTSGFNILNVKINAINGNIISEKFESLFGFRVK